MNGKELYNFELPQKTAAQLADMLAYRIKAGHYAPGDPMPSCRELARKLRMDKNTVNKSYQMLKKRGLVQSIVGKGVFATTQLTVPAAGSQVREAIDATVWQARALGVQEDELWMLLIDAIWRYYGVTHANLVLIECNEFEARHMARQLEAQLQMPVDTALLSDFLSNKEHFIENYDFLLTTFHHLSALTDASNLDNRQIQVIGLHSLPVVENMLQIARAKKGTKVGVVCSTEPSVNSLTGLVKSNNADIKVYSHLMTNKDGLERFVAEMDLIIDTMSTHQFVQELASDAAIITIAFEINDQSLDFLKTAVFRFVKEKIKHSLAPSLSSSPT
jgi:DNA-binding transcriptional regulator YhcF (GntR family)